MTDNFYEGLRRAQAKYDAMEPDYDFEEGYRAYWEREMKRCAQEAEQGNNVNDKRSPLEEWMKCPKCAYAYSDSPFSSAKFSIRDMIEKNRVVGKIGRSTWICPKCGMECIVEKAYTLTELESHVL